MGQSMSRRPQPARPDTQSAPRASQSTSGSEPTLRTPTSSVSDKRSRRLSVRRSMANLLPHSHSSTSVSSEISQGSKRRWRSSRRWSKAPEQLSEFEVPRSTDALPVDPSASVVEQVSQNEKEEAAGQDPSTDPLVEGTSKLDQPEVAWNEAPRTDSAHEDVAVRRSPHSHASLRLPTMYEDSGEEDEDAAHHQETSQDYNAIVDAAIGAQAHETERRVPRIHIGAESSDMDVDTPFSSVLTSQPEVNVSQADSTSVPEPPAEPMPPVTRQFPPPGTLVVVQGVVNTTDAPSNNGASAFSRPARSSAPRPSSTLGPSSATSMRRSGSTPPSGSRTEERSSARNRLSAFIPRPASMLSRRSSDDGRASALDGNAGRNSISSEVPTHINRENSASEDSTASASTDDRDSMSAESDSRPRPLSPSSIDVLGTLLSVAAAATAASLFSPGFSGNGPTNGLGGLSGLGALAGLGLGQAGSQNAQVQRSNRDRILQVWDNFRDRVGFNSRNANDANDGAQSESPSNGTPEARMRPGEMMLAEMARALNVGLGLNGDGNPTEQSENGESAPSSASGPSEPPEDSFERFLMNLQADLRAVLTADGTAARTREDTQDGDRPDSANQDHDEPIAGPSSPRAPSTSIAPEEIRPNPAGEGCDKDEGDDAPPPLVDESDSDTDDDDGYEDSRMDVDSEETYHGDAHSARRTPTPIPPAGIPFGVDQRPAGAHMGANAESDRRPPGINLWRLYRFQPIPAVQTQHAASTSQGQPNTAPETTLSSAPAPASQPSPSTPLSAEPGSASPTTTTTTPAPLAPVEADTNANVVVPVIVVGLQSVDMGQSQTRVRDGDDHMHTHDPDDARASGYGSGMFEGAAHGEGSSTPRGRTWSSRAASALRTLRPGRRGGSRGRPSGEGSGSRTFLIYVIGGYYPPNHHMVTGSDSLDSYEALWELAELLGQVKPPTATREDIENSGLEIVQAADLLELQKTGRVASNCIERCLICLDDYDPDDQLRLMSCKHAFHVDCVDKWLQVGRNNCPACRTKGVSTAGEPTS